MPFQCLIHENYGGGGMNKIKLQNHFFVHNSWNDANKFCEGKKVNIVIIIITNVSASPLAFIHVFFSRSKLASSPSIYIQPVRVMYAHKKNAVFDRKIHYGHKIMLSRFEVST